MLSMLCVWQVPDLVVHEEEVYEDEDDENEEANWRNDYPDEESDGDSDREERYGGTCLLLRGSIVGRHHCYDRRKDSEDGLVNPTVCCRLLGGGALVQPEELGALPEGAAARAGLPRPRGGRGRRGRRQIRLRLMRPPPNSSSPLPPHTQPLHQ